MSRHKKPREIISCKTCTKEFESKRPYRKGVYCSKKCVRYGGSKESLGHMKGKGFWQISTEDQKLERIKQLFENIVIKLGFDKCWGWKNRLLSVGYTSIYAGPRKYILGHRASWIIHNGIIPDGLFVLHKCDNPICTNPDHLFLGTNTDNVKDCIKKGRKNPSFGENHYNVRLSSDQVKEIKIMTKEGYSQSQLGNKFNVSPSTIQNIVDGKTWKHIRLE